MTEKIAQLVAEDLNGKGRIAKVGSYTTNGQKQFVVHVTHTEKAANEVGERPLAYTLSTAP